jgi:hypothetical protein
MSGLPPIATELQTFPGVRFVPITDIAPIIQSSSPRASSMGGDAAAAGRGAGDADTQARYAEPITIVGRII